ncbi:aromatic compound dioxygenase [Meredithblackwellia eburnea MCA 4105]
MRTTASIISILSIAGVALAHDESKKTPAQVEAYRRQQESIYHCAPQIIKYNAERKAALQQVLGHAHPTDASTMFVGEALNLEQGETTALACKQTDDFVAKIKNNTCVLSPETTQGPYYHDRGHPIRQRMAELQLGLPFLMDIGVIDVKTCKPLENVLVDIWHANTTGHYAGHPDQAPELKWEGPAQSGKRKGLLSKYPRTEPEETWLRAAWPTNKNGVAQFSSIFPGYYTGRATHVHVKIHTKWEPHTNGTFTSGHMVHTGQFFVPDDINEVVDKIHPYTENPIKNLWGRTRNWADSLQIYQDSHENGYGPVFDLEFLGGVIQQGLLGSITVGVDLTNDFDPSEAWTP